MVKTDAQGRMYTVADPTPIDLAKARRECLDVIQGNVQFHTDTLGPGKPAAPPAEPGKYSMVCYCAFVGGICEVCRDA
jgi:hypothetical protein